MGPAVWWSVVAILLAFVAQIVGLGESWSSGRPWAGHWAYLSTLAALAASTSVLNARRPGSGVWALLMGVLVLVFLLPWLEGRTLVRSPAGWERLRLTAPWTIFFGLLVVTGVTNYLPTRFGPAAIAFGIAMVLVFRGLTQTHGPIAWRGWTWSAAPWCLAVAIAVADVQARREAKARDRLERLWSWFRDHWGVVWALRVQERFHRTAELSGWSIRLTWQGVAQIESVDPDHAAAERDAAEATLKMLLRRFAEKPRLDQEAGGQRSPET
jgi:hypothetical protein